MSDGKRRQVAVVPEHKRQSVAELAEKLGRMRSAVLSDYRGLTVAQLEELRSSLRGEQVEYIVIKNTLARRAGEEAGLADLASQLTGPTAIAISYDDVVAPARLLVEYARVNRRQEMVRGGMAEGQALSAGEVRQLAELPAREILMAQLLAVVEAAAAQLVALFDAPTQDLLGLLTAKAEAQGGDGADE